MGGAIRHSHSERALEWIMENLVDDGDEIVAVRVIDAEQDCTLAHAD